MMAARRNGLPKTASARSENPLRDCDHVEKQVICPDCHERAIDLAVKRALEDIAIGKAKPPTVTEPDEETMESARRLLAGQGCATYLDRSTLYVHVEGLSPFVVYVKAIP